MISADEVRAKLEYDQDTEFAYYSDSIEGAIIVAANEKKAESVQAGVTARYDDPNIDYDEIFDGIIDVLVENGFVVTKVDPDATFDADHKTLYMNISWELQPEPEPEEES